MAKYCIDKTYEIIGQDNISEIIEPSAGNGSFSNQLNCIAYDIEPENNEIIKQDYLTLGLEYKKGRLIISNPPFGRNLTLATKFFKKAIKECDYIAFILPIGQLNNSTSLYEFDLIHSEDLGLKHYTDRDLHCCFNIYKRPTDGLNKKKNNKLKDIDIKEYRKSRNQHIPKDFNYDIRFCFWGTVGKECEYEEQYSHEMAIRINNDTYKDRILELLRNAKWQELYPQVKTPCLYQWQIYKYIKENISEIN